MKILITTKRNIVFIVFFSIFFFLPFFWLQPGQVNLGGDSSRLYLYDPWNYLRTFPFWGIAPGSTGYESVSYFFIPFTLFFLLLQIVLQSPWIVVNVFNGITLSFSFAFIVLIIREILHRDGEEEWEGWWAAILSGALYVIAPMIWNWDKALTSHSQIFLNPLIFYLFIRYIHTNKPLFGVIALITTVLFAPNFSFIAAPSLFSFYPIVLLYLFLYKRWIVKTPFRWKTILFMGLLYLSLHAFHLAPQLYQFLDPQSNPSQRIFSPQFVSEGVSHFTSVANGISLAKNIALIVSSEKSLVPWDVLMYIFPIILVSGFVITKKNYSTQMLRWNMVLLAGCFFVVLFFDTANITHIGFTFYQHLFRLPGLSMFRNFYGQFLYVYVFFYCLLFGHSLYIVFRWIGKRKNLWFIGVLSLILIANGWPFLNGSMIKLPIYGTKNIHVPFHMDPNFEKTLSYIRSLPVDGKMLTLPLTDYGYQVLAGTDEGMYIGPSLIGYLTGKKDFMGYDALAPFGELFIQLAKDKNYDGVTMLMSWLNIRYIFYNNDPRIYEKFPLNPYMTMKKLWPSQQIIQDFIEKLPVKKIFSSGDRYLVYEISDSHYLPYIYIPKKISYLDQSLIGFVTPFSFESNDARLMMFNQKDIIERFPYVANDIFVVGNRIADVSPKYSTLPNIVRVSDYVPPELYALLKPLISLQEKDSNMYQQYNYKQRTIADERLTVSDKYINTISLSDTLVVSGLRPNFERFTTDPLNEKDNVLLLRSARSWEEAFTTYFEMMINTFIISKQLFNDHFYSFENYRVKIRDGIIKNEQQINFVLEQSSLSTSDKNYLFTLWNQINDSLLQKLEINSSYERSIAYNVNIPEDGNYDVFVENSFVRSRDRSSMNIVLDNSVYQLDNFYAFPNWAKFYKSVINKGVSAIHVQMQQSITDTEKRAIQIIKESSSSNFDDSLFVSGAMKDIVHKGIEHFSLKNTNNSQYFISLKYSFPSITDPKIQNTKEKPSWFPYEVFLESGSDAEPDYMKMLIDPSNLLHHVQDMFDLNYTVKDVSVINVKSPRLLLRKINSNTYSNNPIISFQRISPVKYIIHVSNASAPFMLVSSDAYSKNWKLYKEPTLPNDSPMNKKDTALSYFGGDIKELNVDSSFFDKLTSYSWFKKPIAESKHFMVNGYANGWYIEPIDTNREKNYVLIMELYPQRIFFVGFLISSLFFSVCVVWLGIESIHMVNKKQFL